jgi:signal transduction histidine kinase
MPIGRLFAKVFLWYWATALALVTIFVGSRMIGTSVLAPDELIAALAPSVADQAAQAYESGGPQKFLQFERSLMGNQDRKLFLIDELGKDVLSRPIPSDSRTILQAARTDGRILARYSIASRSASYRFTSASGHPYIILLHISAGFGKLLENTPRGTVLFFAGVLLIVTLLCAWLAHHIVDPIQGIQSAARKVAQGDLTVRAPAKIARRHDELAALAVDFDSMVERIGALVRSQKDLLHTVSHELRSPLARLSFSLGFFQRQPNTEYREMLQRMERDIERTDHLIGQLLTLSRLDTGSISPDREEVDFSQLVQEVVADGNFEAQMSGKSVTLETENDIVIPDADQAALRSACENILRNAIRFTPPGRNVEVLLTRSSRSDSQALLSVRDSGPGVPEEFLERIFEPFFRVKGQAGSSGGEGDGHGLGLAIALRAIGLHCGSIAASNVAPSGLKIEIRLRISSPAHLPEHIRSAEGA